MPQQDPSSQAPSRHRKPLRIGSWTLRADVGVLIQGEEERRLHPKALEVLLVLVDAGPRAVSRDELFDRVWGRAYTSDQALSRAVADLRAALGEKAGDARYVRTVPKFGYQLVADVGAVDQARAPTPVNPGPTLRWLVPAGLAAAALAALLLIPLAPEVVDEKPPETWGEQRPLTAAPGLEHQPRWSSDGQWVVYARLQADRADWDLWRISPDTGEEQALATTPSVSEHGPAIAPDGGQFAYVRLEGGRCDVVTQALPRGTPEAIATCTNRFPTLVDWSPDGHWISYTAASEANGPRPIVRRHQDTGIIEPLTRPVSSTGTDFYPRFSPDGTHLAFLRGEPHPDHRTRVGLVDLRTGTEFVLPAGPSQHGGMTWLDPRTLLFTNDSNGRMTGWRYDLVSEAITPAGADGVIHPDYHPRRGLVASSPRRDLDLAVLEPDGQVRPVAQSTHDDLQGAFSPDGQWIAFISRRSGFEELWVASSDDQVARRLTRFEGTPLGPPAWHPDGRQLVLAVGAGADEQIIMVELISGQVQPFALQQPGPNSPSFLASGTLIHGCQAAAVCLWDGTEDRILASGLFRPRASGPSIFAVDASGTLQRLDPTTGEATALWTELPSRGRAGWTVHSGEIFYLAAGDGGESGRIIRRDIETGASTRLLETAMPINDVTLSVSPATGSVLFTRHQAASDDLVRFELPHGRR